MPTGTWTQSWYLEGQHVHRAVFTLRRNPAKPCSCLSYRPISSVSTESLSTVFSLSRTMLCTEKFSKYLTTEEELVSLTGKKYVHIYVYILLGDLLSGIPKNYFTKN